MLAASAYIQPQNSLPDGITINVDLTLDYLMTAIR